MRYPPKVPHRTVPYNSPSGDWRAASVLPDGTPDAAIREFNLELKANGTSVTGTVTGSSIVIREGRIEGNVATVVPPLRGYEA